MSIRALINAAVKCVKCGEPIGCRCWVPCYCGWTKERGAEGCRRCLAVTYAKIGPSRYQARIGEFTVRTEKVGIHWVYEVRDAAGAVVASHGGWGTNKGAKALGTAGAYRLGAESPPPQVVASSGRSRKGARRG